MSTLPYDCYTSGEYLKNNPTWDSEDSAWKATKVRNMLDKNKIYPKSIVEVGCGAGGVLADLHATMPSIDLVGYDISPDASKFWSNHIDKGIKLFVGNFVESKTDKFDAMLLLDVIEHVVNPFDFLLSLHGRAKYFVFHIPLDLSVSTIIRENSLVVGRTTVGHIHYFTKGIALSLLQECGFKIVDWSYTGAGISGPKTTFRGRLIRPIRRALFALNYDLGVRIIGGDTLMVLASGE